MSGAAHPGGGRRLLLTAFLAAATVPALLSWTSRTQGRAIRSRLSELDQLLAAGIEDRRESLPGRVVTEVPAAELVRIPAATGLRFRSELVFSAAQIDLFRRKSAREGEFERALKPPEGLAATATRNGIEVVWSSPPGLAEVTAALRDEPLLRLGFRVYRWREGDEPKLLATLEGSRTAYQDRDLPIRQERFFYCVATVLEGTIGDLPTLIESKLSPVITAETLENYTLELLGGTEEVAELALEAWVDGAWRRCEIDLSAGDRVAASIARERDGRIVDVELDTGLEVSQIRWLEGTLDTEVQHAEFLPDGRRKLDPSSGLPTFRTEAVTIPTRTLELVLAEPSGRTRTLSPAEAR